MRKPLLPCLTATLLASLLWAAAPASAQVIMTPRLLPTNPALIRNINLNRRMTNFKPEVNGFRFYNSFKIVTGIGDITANGLCGGMVYTALDYFQTGVPLPTQDYTPAPGTRLQSYISGRHITSLANVMPKWLELHGNAFGARNSEFFNWGLQGFGGGRLQELKTEIDAGRPVPLGLKSLSADPSNDHVILAVGYDTGRYKGDLGEFKDDLKIFVYDPNSANHMQTLYPVSSEQKYCMNYDNGPHCWRAYFVMNGAWSAQTPPAISSAAKELQIAFQTGGDDLRGGNDNVSVDINLQDGSTIHRDNVNLGQRWIDNTWQDIGIDLPDSVTPASIQSVRFTTSFRGGFDGDNWNMDRIIIQFRDSSGTPARCDRNPDPKPLMRFTGDRREFTTPFPC